MPRSKKAAEKLSAASRYACHPREGGDPLLKEGQLLKEVDLPSTVCVRNLTTKIDAQFVEVIEIWCTEVGDQDVIGTYIKRASIDD